jgi:hypothetical protein
VALRDILIKPNSKFQNQIALGKFKRKPQQKNLQKGLIFSHNIKIFIYFLKRYRDSIVAVGEKIQNMLDSIETPTQKILFFQTLVYKSHSWCSMDIIFMAGSCLKHDGGLPNYLSPHVLNTSLKILFIK